MFAHGMSSTDGFTNLPESEQQGPNCRMRSMTVMFTDMAGSTRFAEKFGARAALQKRKRHNGLLLPLIDDHRGQLVEIVGDALMVIFEQVCDAARCAIAMQMRLAEYNASDDVDVEDLEIHIRAGIHTGKLVAFRDGEHFEVAGRAVNVAARVEAANRKKTDQILISDTTHVELEPHSEFRTSPLATIKPKGVGQLRVHRLLWEDDAGIAAVESDATMTAEIPKTSECANIRPKVLSASSATVEPTVPAPSPASSTATLRACQSLFLDMENQQGHVLPVWVRLQTGKPHSVHTRINCDAVMQNSALQAVHSAFHLVRESGFDDIHLDNHAIEWWVGKQEIRYEGASLGLAVAMATISALTGLQVDSRTAVTGAVERGQLVAVTGISEKWESIRSLGTFSRLIVAPGNLADLPAEAWSEPNLKISAVPTLEAAVAEVFGGMQSTRLANRGEDTVIPDV